MAGQLKEVRNRIKSVQSTQQITKAMKMVSAAKLRRAQDAIIQMRPYAKKMQEMQQVVFAFHKKPPLLLRCQPLIAHHQTALYLAHRGQDWFHFYLPSDIANLLSHRNYLHRQKLYNQKTPHRDLHL